MATLLEERNSAKNNEFLPVTSFFVDYSFNDDCFYRRLIFTEEYSYRQFFCKQEHLVFYLKNTLSLSVRL